MFIDMVMINISEIKLDDITVTFQPSKPSMPITDSPANRQLAIGNNTHLMRRKINHNVASMNRTTPAPNTTRSLAI